MDELIRISHDNERPTTSARTLWEFLDKPYTEFIKWFDQFKQYGFAENEDYTALRTKIRTAQGNEMDVQDYEITIDMAKELSMLQRTEKGKIARQHYIELERKWNSPTMVMARSLQFAAKQIDGLTLQLNMKDQVIKELKPKADYTDSILKNKGLVTITQIAKDYGMSGQEMNDILHELKVQYKQSEQWLLYEKHQDKGYTHSETISITRTNGRPDVKMNTKWTQKGRLFIYGLLKKSDILPVIEQKCLA